MESQEVTPAGGSPYDIITGETTHSRQISGIASALKRVPLFADMEVADRELVASLVQRSEAQPGDVLVRQDEPGREFLIIVEGTARVETDGRQVAPFECRRVFRRDRDTGWETALVIGDRGQPDVAIGYSKAGV